MAEERVNIAVENGQTILEGLFEKGSGGRNAIICHPHPLYGGDMHNNVVQAARHTFATLGWTTLRFNFRTAGGGVPPQAGRAVAESPGAGSAARGQDADGVPSRAAREQNDGMDLLDVYKFMGSRSPGPIDLAGYSYGAWAAMEAARAGLCPDSLILVSPPLDFISFVGLKPPHTPTLITLGDRDDFCSVGALKSWLSTSPHSDIAVEILPEVDHFYRGAERELSDKMKAFLTRMAA